MLFICLLIFIQFACFLNSSDTFLPPTTHYHYLVQHSTLFWRNQDAQDAASDREATGPHYWTHWLAHVLLSSTRKDAIEFRDMIVRELTTYPACTMRHLVQVANDFELTVHGLNREGIYTYKTTLEAADAIATEIVDNFQWRWRTGIPVFDRSEGTVFLSKEFFLLKNDNKRSRRSIGCGGPL